jgi:glycosyltransferase involved in cell wall biosynthesis
MTEQAQGTDAQRERDMPRIAFVTDIPTPYMLAVFEALAERCRLTVLFCSLSGTRAMPWSSAQMNFPHRFVGGGAIRRGTPDATDFYPSPRLLRALAADPGDVIISGGFSFPSLYAALYSRMAGKRLLIHSDGTSRSEAGIGRGQRLTRALLARMAHGAIGNSRQAVERFVELGFDPVFEAPHSSDLDPFLEVARSRKHESPGELRLITAGRLIPRKGVDRLLRAVARARADGARVKLTVVGSGEQDLELRGLAIELGLGDMEWLGFVEQRELPALFARADAFAFPTLDDPFGIVLLEAAASGLALLASPHGGATGDLVEDGREGFVIEPDDTDGFAAAIRALAADRDLCARMGEAAYARAHHRTPGHTADAYVRAALVARPPRPSGPQPLEDVVRRGGQPPLASRPKAS